LSGAQARSEPSDKPSKVASTTIERSSVSTNRFILFALLCCSPAILLWDGLMALGLVAEVLAIALVIAARSLRSGETGFLISIIRWPLTFAALPAVWILIQALPLHLFAHPIWKSAEAALGHLGAAISADPGATLIALGQYLSMIAAAFLAAAVAVDRQRAEWVFFALIIATTAIAAMYLVHELFFPGSWLSACAQEQALDCSAMGTIIAGTACIRALERSEMRQAAHRSAAALPSSFAAPCAALAICAAAVLLPAITPILFAIAYGLAPLVCVLLIRRFDLGLLGIIGLAVVTIGVAILMLAAHPSERATSISLSFAMSSPALRSLSQHVLDDAPLVGTGARTFLALAPVYREINDPQPACSAATAAVTFAIELGRPMLWLIVLGTLLGIVVLLSDALQRGRDWFYPTMGGGCLLTILLMSFINAGLLGTASGLTIAAAVGLAFAQSKSRSAKF
jgi:hypothetical protein